MKRILALTLVATLTFSAVGCTNNKTADSATENSQPITTTAEDNNETKKVEEATKVDDSKKAEVVKDIDHYDMGEANPAAGTIIPTFEVKDINNNTVTNDIFKKNKVTILNIWGTFCGPCIEEMPDLQKLYENYSDKAVGIVGLTTDVTENDDTSEALSIMEMTGVKYPLIKINNDLEAIANNFDYVPVSLFVDSEGKILKTIVAGGASYSEFESIIKKYLEL